MEKGKPPPCLLGATSSAITAPARRRGPGPRPVTSFDYNLRHNPSTNSIAHNTNIDK
jgi:hypothetical protein